MRRRKHNTKKVTRRRKIKYLIILLLVVIIISIVFIRYNCNKATISKGHITRTCKQVLKFLDEEPEDITSKQYKSHIPKQIQEDIETMLNSEEGLDIIYTIKGQEVISIEKSDYAQSGIIVNIKKDDYTDEIMTNEFSFYRNGNKIIVYGIINDSTRCLKRYEIDSKNGYNTSDTYDIDLLGTKLEYLATRVFQPDMTLVISQNNFMLYCLGEQVGEAVEVPNSTIQDVNYHYILGKDQTFYYLYFCSNKKAPWIRLVKVDNDVVMAKGNYVSTDTNIKYPIYYKGGKRYVGVPNEKMVKYYAQNYGEHYEIADVDILDFGIEIIELTEGQISKVIVQRRYENDGEYDWYLHYCYEANGQTVYEEKRINGLDSYLTRIIPEECMSSIDGMEISPNEVDKVVNELKQIYEEYENEDKL